MYLTSAIKEFLDKTNFTYVKLDFNKAVEAFIAEMKLGLSKDEQELRMIPTYVETPRALSKSEPVVVIDAGGTNLRVAKACLNDKGEICVDNFSKYKMPGTVREFSCEEFYDSFADYVLPLITQDTKIGFCFSYPIESYPNNDGRILYFSKEVKVPEAVGTFVGEELKKALKRKSCEYNLEVVVLNDTVTTLLAGYASLLERKYSSYIGFILGTGTNTCYIESNQNISKLAALSEGTQILNIESGNYAGFSQSDFDKSLDAESSSSTMYSFEKMTSGAYLGRLFELMLEGAISENLIMTDNCPQGISTKDLNDYCLYPEADNLLAKFSKNLDDESRRNFDCLIEALLERAAQMVAILLSAVTLKSTQSKHPFYPVCIAIDGTNYKGDYFLRERIEYYLYDYLRMQKGIYYELKQVSDASLVGAAVAALSI